MHKNIFSKEYFDFFEEIVTSRQYQPNLEFQKALTLDQANSDKYYDLEVLKLGILFLLTTILRDKPRNGIIKFLPFLKEQLRQVLLLFIK